MELFPYHRISVVGTTSSGKSTLAKKLAEKISGDYIELDALYWEANWVGAELSVFRQRVETATRSQVWVTAGNYHGVRDLIWPKAEVVVWLDYPLPLLFWRLIRRTVRRGITQEELWNGNRETFWRQLKLWSDDSLIYWLFKSYWRRKREFPLLFSQPEYSHLKIYHFTSTAETDTWFINLNCTGRG